MVTLNFHASERSESKNTLQVYENQFNEILIRIDDPDNDYYSALIPLDKETAIKFSKELRKQIALIIEGGSNDQ